MKKWKKNIKMSCLLKINNLNITIDKKRILQNINFQIKHNEKVFVIGSSGVGKTTLLNSILDSKIISDGEIIFNYEVVSKYKSKKKLKWNKSIGTISQKDHFLEWDSVYNNIKNLYPNYKNSFYEFFNIINKKQKNEIFKIAKKLKIQDILFKKISDISGGEKQRVKILILLLKSPMLILADEPTTSLDIKKSIEIINALCNIKNTAMLINIHKINLIPNDKYRVIAIKNKKIVFDGIKKDLSEKRIKEIYE